MLSHFSCVLFFVTPWTAACQAPLSMGFPRLNTEVGYHALPSGDLSDPGIKPASLKSTCIGRQGLVFFFFFFFTTSATWEAHG